MNQRFREIDSDSDTSENDGLRSEIDKEWERFVEDSDYLLFGLPQATLDLAALHPDLAQSFKLWQVFLDNVNPLLKVVHAPSLQSRIVEAGSNTDSNAPPLQALMLGIYCTAVLSLTADDCNRIFGSSRQELLMRYQFGCQRALWNCKFLRSNDRDCLTALYLYLVSIRPSTAPQSLSCMLGVAIRIAQRMGIHNEANLAKLNPFDAELSRRLWWSLVLFDTRIGGIAGNSTVTLDPTWDCEVPLNINDSELWPQMKQPPSPEMGVSKASEAIFVHVRSELSDYIRYTDLHLDFTNPTLKAIPKPRKNTPARNGEIAKLEQTAEQQYLKLCDTENALHFMTVWSTRAYLAKFRFLECQSNPDIFSDTSSDQRQDTATSHAIRMLECDTQVMTSSLTQGFLWFNLAYFPFPAFMQIAQDLKQRPHQKHAAQAWKAMDESFEAWSSQFRGGGPFFHIFAKLVLSAWESCEKVLDEAGEIAHIPKIVRSISQMQADASPPIVNINAKQSPADIDMASNNYLQQALNFGHQGTSYGTVIYNGSGIMQPEIYPGMFAQDMHFDWNMLSGWTGG